ncbi:MAG: hypothetical protein QXM16_07040 [Nitrososphaerota archaeon]
MFLRTLVEAYGRYPVWTDGAPWYSEACTRLGLTHHRYRFGERLFRAIERAVQMLKDRTENFDDYFPCRKKACMEVAKPTPSVQPARDATPDKEHKREL